MEKNPIKMNVLSSNQKSMRTHIRRTVVQKKPRRISVKKTQPVRTKRRRNSISNQREIRNDSLDLAPKVRRNKKNASPMMFNFDDMNNDFFEFEKINSFLKLSLRSKNLKDYIKKNQIIFDKLIDRLDQDQWMGIDLKLMHLFFVDCFKNKVKYLLFIQNN